MITVNENYLKLQASYLFSEIAKRVNAHQKAHPDKEIIKLGIGVLRCGGICVYKAHRFTGGF